MVLTTVLTVVVGCAENGLKTGESILWNKAGPTAIGPVSGNIRVLVIDTPPPKIVFDGIAGNFGASVARGADTGARHGAMLGNVGLYGSCSNAGCAVLLLVSAVLALGGAAIGAIFGAIDGGVQALGDSDSDEVVAAREKVMKKALAALPLRKEMATGISQQIYETSAKQLFYDDQIADGNIRPYFPRRPEYQIRISEINAIRVGREGAARLRVVATGQMLLSDLAAAEPKPISAEFITNAYQLKHWFAEDAKLFRQSLLLGVRLTSAKLVDKLQRALRRQ